MELESVSPSLWEVSSNRNIIRYIRRSCTGTSVAGKPVTPRARPNPRAHAPRFRHINVRQDPKTRPARKTLLPTRLPPALLGVSPRGPSVLFPACSHIHLASVLFIYYNYVQVMGEKGMLSLGNPPSSGLEFFDSQGCSTSPPEHSFPQRFREVCTYLCMSKKRPGI